MTTFARRAAALLAASAIAGAAAAPPAPAPAPAVASAPTLSAAQRQEVSALIGFDVAQSIEPVKADMDLAAFERSVRNVFDKGKPLLSEQEAARVGDALMRRIGLRNGRAPEGAAPGTPPPEVSKEHVGYLVGADVGRSLAPIKDEIDLAVMIRSLQDTFAGKPYPTDEATRNKLRETFAAQMRAKHEARAKAQASTNLAEGAKFLAENKAKKGVFTTASGLQYMVLRQGAGARPRGTDKVRVNYHGTLLDGTVFDSSYDRGQPAEFMLNQVIAGWTEGVAMMPVGAKYRFWVPSALGYGERGAGGDIGPNATLVFDVELLAIAQ